MLRVRHVAMESLACTFGWAEGNNNKTITLPNVTKHLHRPDATGSEQFLLNIVQKLQVS